MDSLGCSACATRLALTESSAILPARRHLLAGCREDHAPPLWSPTVISIRMMFRSGALCYCLISVIEFFKAAEELLYHYTRPSVAIDHILKNRTLRFGMYTNTNDPKESKTWQFDLGSNWRPDFGKYDMTSLSSWLSTEIKAKARLACFSMDTPPLIGNHLEDIFRRGFCKPRMWAHYAERHTGVCLVFDRQKLRQLVEGRFETGHLIFGGPVEYVDRGVVRRLEDQAYVINVDHLESVGREAYARDHLVTHFKRLFFEKMTDWRDESEYRLVVVAEPGGDLYFEFCNALVGIVFGEYTEDSAIDQLIK
jgi:hypothetical protein